MCSPADRRPVQNRTRSRLWVDGPWLGPYGQAAGSGGAAGARQRDISGSARSSRVRAKVRWSRQAPSMCRYSHPQPLVAEAQLLDDPQAGGVLRPDVDLHPVQPERAEAVVRRHRHRRRHDAAPGVRLARSSSPSARTAASPTGSTRRSAARPAASVPGDHPRQHPPGPALAAVVPDQLAEPQGRPRVAPARSPPTAAARPGCAPAGRARRPRPGAAAAAARSGPR